MFTSILSLALTALAATGASATKPLVTREPTNLLCEHGYLKTVEALRSAIDHFDIAASANGTVVEEIAWDVEFEDELNAQLRPTRTMFVYDEKFDELVQYDNRALLFLPLSIGVYVGADGHTHMAFHDGDHFLANFDVYEAEEGLDAVDEVLWTLAKAAHCKFPKGDFEQSASKGSTTRARIGTEARATLEIVKLREQGTPGLIENCNKCLWADISENVEGPNGEIFEDFFLQSIGQKLEDEFQVEQELLLRSENLEHHVLGFLNTEDDYYYLRQFGQAASAILPIRVAFTASVFPGLASEESDFENSNEYDANGHSYCVSTLGTEYYEAVFGVELLPDTCDYQSDIFDSFGEYDEGDSNCGDSGSEFFSSIHLADPSEIAVGEEE